MKIAVIGAGIFGCTAAIHLSRLGFNVTLIDKADSILRGATTANQLRLHRGFHYPRSPETIESCKAGADLFREEYGPAVDYSGRQFYGLARDTEQKTNPMQYQEVCFRNGLIIKNELPPFALSYDSFEAVYEVSEAHINLPMLRNLVWAKLWENVVDCRFECEVDFDGIDLHGYDKVVIATYGQTNLDKTKHHYELIEKPVVHIMNPDWAGNSLVVMDGPYFSIDPILGSHYHFLGHVKHCIHDQVDSNEFDFGNQFIDKGLIPADHIGGESAFEDFLYDIAEFVPDLVLEHIGSYFTVRVVKSNVDDTDERPTIVKEIDDKYIEIFSGKIGNCVDAALEVAEICSR